MSAEVNVSKIVCWTDSLVSLCRIKKIDKEWKVWVDNRVRQIRNFVDSSNWRHVPGELNPTYIPTRENRSKT